MNTNKTLYGIMAFAPLALMLLGFVLFIAAMVSSGMLNDGPAPDESVIFLLGFFGLTGVGALLGIVSMIMYIVHISKNPAIPEDQRILWILGIVFFNGIVNIVYFFLYITKEGDQPRQVQPKSPWD